MQNPQTQTLKFVFFGTPNVASLTLDILKKAGYIPSLIITATDKPQGRKMLLTPPPVKIWAIKNDVPYVQPEKLTQEVLDRIKQIECDLVIVVAYGKIIPEIFIKEPRLGSLNIHYSLLPKYRGASPVESAILNGDTETGVSIQQMEYKMDAGPILAEEKVAILPTETTEELRVRLIEIGGNLLVKILPLFLAEDRLPQKPQDESQATFCKKIKKEDGLVNPLTDDPQTLYNKFRAYHKWPRIYYFDTPKQGEGGIDTKGKRVIITNAELKDGKFIIKKVIPEGGKERTL